jgi:hypothetical protein
MRNYSRNQQPHQPSDCCIDSLRIIGTEESLKRWGWLFQILEEDGTIEIISRPDRTYPMRDSGELRSYWQIQTKF